MNKKTTRRNPLTAFVLSAVMPGLGQLYNGSWNKASWFFLVFVFFCLPVIVVIILHFPAEWVVPGLVAALFLAFLTWVCSILEATLDAVRKKEYQARDWQGSGVYLLVFVIGMLVALPLTMGWVNEKWVQAYQIPSGSMEPTMVAGDFIFADKRYNCPACKYQVQRGDVVIFTYPNNRNINYIKRVIGLPGDRVQLRGETLSVNGKVISQQIQQEPELNVVQETTDDHSWLAVWKKHEAGQSRRDFDATVPPGQVYVLGDNRNASNDSRYFGGVPLVDIKGKARLIWLSFNKELGQLQPGRAGKMIR